MWCSGFNSPETTSSITVGTENSVQIKMREIGIACRMASGDCLRIGDRVGVGNSHGTVKYIGFVYGYSGEWVGIDWDDDNRGKHDGSLNGKHYFDARTETSGSFVRLGAVDLGRSIVDEMQKRYMDDFILNDLNIGSRRIELIAMEKIYKKQNDLWKLNYIVLDNMYAAFPPSIQCSPFVSCMELNLYNNLISSWNDLLKILELFPSLLYLDIRRNIMKPLPIDVYAESVVKAPIFHLVASDCRLDLETANHLMEIFPHLQVLYIAENGLKTFDPVYSDNINLLSLEGNPIEDFARLHDLASLPRLESLSLADCDLTDFRLPNRAGFEALQILNIRDNELSGWLWVEEIAKLPALTDLFYKTHDIDEANLELREILIAKLRKLKMLNRCEISEVERRSSEIRFLNRFGLEPIPIEHQKDIVRLIGVHGEPVPKGSYMDFSMRLVKLRLCYEDSQIERSLPYSMLIKNVIGLARRLFTIKNRKVSCWSVCRQRNVKIGLDNPFKSLDFYSVSDEDSIFFAAA